MGKWQNGTYEVRNKEKYLGKSNPKFRSSWELMFMQFCDNNPAILEWDSEGLRIPYRNPITGKQTIYIPDFLIFYIDKKGKKHAELIEIKPKKEALHENAKSQWDKAALLTNYAKWDAASKWAKRNGVFFRVITEDDMFWTKPKKIKKARKKVVRRKKK